MKYVDGWHWPSDETHMTNWMATPKNRVMLNGRSSYQGKKQLAAIAKCVRYGRQRTAVDVGAHVGLWSFNLASIFQDVHSFEPVALHRECFEKNMALAQNVAHVTLHACALGMCEGSVSIRTTPTSSGDSWIKGDGDIPMRTLDSFSLEDVDFIKVDCEGYEENVLRGATETIAACRPIVMVEQKRDMAEAHFGLAKLGAVNFLLERGYSVAAELSGDYLMVPA